MRTISGAIVAVLATTFVTLTANAAEYSQFQPAAPSATALSRELISLLKSNGIPVTPAGLVLGLHSDSWSVRVGALVALGRIGRYEQLGQVMTLADSRAKDLAGKEVRVNAVLAAIQIGKRTGGLSPILRGRLLSSTRDILAEAKTPVSRLQAAELLGELGDASQFGIVLDSLKLKELAGRALLAVRMYAKLPAAAYGGQTADWVSPVSDVLRNRALSSADRTNAVIALADIGGEDALAAMRSALEDESDQDVRRVLIYSIRYTEARAKGAPSPRKPGSAGSRKM